MLRMELGALSIISTLQQNCIQLMKATLNINTKCLFKSLANKWDDGLFKYVYEDFSDEYHQESTIFKSQTFFFLFS